MGFLWGAQHNFMKFLECFCDTSMGLQKVAYGISMGFLWDFEGFPVDSYRISVGFLQESFGDVFEITIKFQKDFYGNEPGFL